MSIKIYVHIKKIYSYGYGRREKLTDIEGSSEELEKLLLKYDIKEHTQKTESPYKNSDSSVTFIVNHYILTAKISNNLSL